MVLTLKSIDQDMSDVINFKVGFFFGPKLNFFVWRMSRFRRLACALNSKYRYVLFLFSRVLWSLF